MIRVLSTLFVLTTSILLTAHAEESKLDPTKSYAILGVQITDIAPAVETIHQASIEEIKSIEQIDSLLKVNTLSGLEIQIAFWSKGNAEVFMKQTLSQHLSIDVSTCRKEIGDIIWSREPVLSRYKTQGDGYDCHHQIHKIQNISCGITDSTDLIDIQTLPNVFRTVQVIGADLKVPQIKCDRYRALKP